MKYLCGFKNPCCYKSFQANFVKAGMTMSKSTHVGFFYWMQLPWFCLLPWIFAPFLPRPHDGVVGDSAQLHDHPGGHSGPAAGHRGGPREARPWRREAGSHPARSGEQKVHSHQSPAWFIHESDKIWTRSFCIHHPKSCCFPKMPFGAIRWR